jgi:hypothetical protein
MRAEPNRRIAFALEIKASAPIIDQWKVLEPALPDSELDHGPPLGLETQWLDPGELGNFIDPSSGRIDQNRARELLAIGKASAPPIAYRLRANHAAARRDSAAGTTESGEIGGMEARHVDIGATRLEHRSVPFGPDPRNHALDHGTVDPFGRNSLGNFGPFSPSEMERSAAPEEAALGEGGRRRI